MNIFPSFYMPEKQENEVSTKSVDRVSYSLGRQEPSQSSHVHVTPIFLVTVFWTHEICCWTDRQKNFDKNPCAEKFTPAIWNR